MKVSRKNNPLCFKPLDSVIFGSVVKLPGKDNENDLYLLTDRSVDENPDELYCINIETGYTSQVPSNTIVSIIEGEFVLK